MKNQLLAVLSSLSLTLQPACAGSRAPQPNSGIDVRLNGSADPSAARPEGVFHVQGIHNGVSAYVPVAPLEADRHAQRVPLPPGAYSVSYSPVVLDMVLGSLRNRAAAQVLSPNPFLIEVGEGEFHIIDVRAVTGAPKVVARPTQRSLAGR